MNGLDATAARTFGILCATLRMKGVSLIITHVPKGQMRRLLAAHGVTAPPEEAPAGSARPDHTCLAFPSMDAGMQVRHDVWAEQVQIRLPKHVCP